MVKLAELKVKVTAHLFYLCLSMISFWGFSVPVPSEEVLVEQVDQDYLLRSMITHMTFKLHQMTSSGARAYVVWH